MLKVLKVRKTIFEIKLEYKVKIWIVSELQYLPPKKFSEQLLQTSLFMIRTKLNFLTV